MGRGVLKAALQSLRNRPLLPYQVVGPQAWRGGGGLHQGCDTFWVEQGVATLGVL